ncbi:hypothetical protein OPQ81_003044 [Rhizoctonia solani]|nr:hypothetical protein OPQ81_003044 [Rhizoctonia solani]
MEKDESISKIVPISDSARSSEVRSSDSVDGERLTRMGYKPELKRNLGIASLLGFGFSVTNSWWGGERVFGSRHPERRTSSHDLWPYIYCVPLGGQYYWAGQIAPKKYARPLAFLTGALGWAGAMFASSSVTLGLASSLVGLYALGHPEFIISPWMVFVTYQLVNAFGLVFNCFHRILPALSTGSLYISIIAWLVTTILVPAVSNTKQPAEFVFATFINQTGWDSNVIAFIVGLVSPSWCFAALDVVTHMAEEIHQPERMIPRTILITVLIGLVSSLTYTIAMVFSITNFKAVAGSATGVPILELYYEATRSLAGAIGLHVLFLLTGFGCLIGCHSWQTRLAWSFSRDHGLPGSQWWSVVNAITGVPLNAHLMSCAWVALLGCLFIASSTAFNRVYCLSLSFVFRPSSLPPDPCLVFFSFPFVMPIAPGNMNYVSVVIVGYVVYLCGYWYIRGRHVFRVPEVDGGPIIRSKGGA